MPYRYLEDIATADAAFDAWGTTREELFATAADALLGIMVAKTDDVSARRSLTVTLHHEDLELLLFDFLQELIFLKDSQRLLLRVRAITITNEQETLLLKAELSGELIDSARLELLADAKAITLHQFRIENEGNSWKARVIVDV
jgi:SHS2 domain-containing protein